jgi:hypothetical protein
LGQGEAAASEGTTAAHPEPHQPIYRFRGQYLEVVWHNVRIMRMGDSSHHRVRARVDHVFARMKNWKVLRDCRRGDSVCWITSGIAHIHNLAYT